MSIVYGGDKITASDGGSLNPLSAIFRNRLIDAGFIINQRVYVSNTALSSGTYAHDRWKAGASGCTYTFTQGSAGVPITITITAGSLQQVIEGCNMPEGGTYILSWEGTAQARFNGGTYGSSPLAVTGITAGANTTIEFNTGTVLKPQLEVGSNATGFEYRQYGQELALCYRYFYRVVDKPSSGYEHIAVGQAVSGGAYFTYQYPVTMRASPSLSYSSLSDFTGWNAGTSNTTPSAISLTNPSPRSTRINYTSTGITAQGASTLLSINSTATFDFSAEL